MGELCKVQPQYIKEYPVDGAIWPKKQGGDIFPAGLSNNPPSPGNAAIIPLMASNSFLNWTKRSVLALLTVIPGWMDMSADS